MKKDHERKFVQFAIDARSLVEYLISHGILRGYYPKVEGYTPPKPSELTEFELPEDLRIIEIQAIGSPVEYGIRISLESDSLPDWFCYRGHSKWLNADFPREKPIVVMAKE